MSEPTTYTADTRHVECCIHFVPHCKGECAGCRRDRLERLIKENRDRMNEPKNPESCDDQPTSWDGKTMAEMECERRDLELETDRLRRRVAKLEATKGGE